MRSVQADHRSILHCHPSVWRPFHRVIERAPKSVRRQRHNDILHGRFTKDAPGSKTHSVALA